MPSDRVPLRDLTNLGPPFQHPGDVKNICFIFANNNEYLYHLDNKLKHKFLTWTINNSATAKLFSRFYDNQKGVLLES